MGNENQLEICESCGNILSESEINVIESQHPYQELCESCSFDLFCEDELDVT